MVEYESLICVAIFANKILPYSANITENELKEDKNQTFNQTFNQNIQNNQNNLNVQNNQNNQNKDYNSERVLNNNDETEGDIVEHIDDEEELKTEYHYMLENILLRMLGYKSIQLYNNENSAETKKIERRVNILIDLVNFFAIIIGLEYNDSNSIFTIYNKKFSNFLKFKKIIEFESIKENTVAKSYTLYENKNIENNIMNNERSSIKEELINNSYLQEIYNLLEKFNNIHTSDLITADTDEINEIYDSIYNKLITFKQKQIKPDRKLRKLMTSSRSFSVSKQTQLMKGEKIEKGDKVEKGKLQKSSSTMALKLENLVPLMNNASNIPKQKSGFNSRFIFIYYYLF